MSLSRDSATRNTAFASSDFGHESPRTRVGRGTGDRQFASRDGLSPAAWERARPDTPGRPDPLMFNMSLVGSGPIMELMCLRRTLADGFRPDVVMIEYWPPFLREDGAFHEPDRIDHNRLFQGDRSLVASYFTKPAEIEQQMLVDRLQPFFRTRHRLLAQISPRWQPWNKRMEMAWANLDAWGWLPGLDDIRRFPPSDRNG